MKVFMPDGTEYQTTIERTTNVKTEVTNGLPPYGSASTTAPTAVSTEPRPRTLLVIANDLDTAQKELELSEASLESARTNRDGARALVAELSRELRNFGVKKRAPKGTP